MEDDEKTFEDAVMDTIDELMIRILKLEVKIRQLEQQAA